MSGHPAWVLAQHFGVSIGTIYRWAHEDQIRRLGHYHARRYDLEQMQAAYDRRHRTVVDVSPVLCEDSRRG